MSDAIGMMEGAFFVSRSEILEWLNDLLKLELTKIEQTASGAVACQVLDAIHPGVLPMSKVNWKATQEYEFINNYKLLQQAFAKLKISKYIEVEKLIKAKYQDNLEFMQWLKRYYDLHIGGGAAHYDATAKRKDASLPAPKPKPAKAPASKGPSPTKKPSPTKTSEEGKTKKASPGTDAELEKLKETTEVIKRERDFYFGKLRDLEILLHFHENDNNQFVTMVKQILYATEDDKITIDNEGTVHFEKAPTPEEDEADPHVMES